MGRNVPEAGALLLEKSLSTSCCTIALGPSKSFDSKFAISVYYLQVSLTLGFCAKRHDVFGNVSSVKAKFSSE